MRWKKLNRPIIFPGRPIRLQLEKLYTDKPNSIDCRENSRKRRMPTTVLVSLIESHSRTGVLRLEQKQIDKAEAAICRLEKEKEDEIARSQILPAYIEIMLASDNVKKTRDAAEELFDIADNLHAPFLRAIAGRAHGCVLLAKDEPERALKKLNPARRLGHPIRACLQKPPARSPPMQQSAIYPSMHMPRPIRSSQTPFGSELTV